jgi:hypothetical protein
MKHLVIFCLALALVGCDGSSNSGTRSAVPNSVANASPGGFWVGMDSNSEAVEILAAEDGVFFFQRGPFADSVGVLGVANGDSINGVMDVTQQYGDFGAAGRVECKLTGSVNARISMLLDVRCRSSQDKEILTTLFLEYDPRYDRGSSLQQITGSYLFDFGSVINITGDGMIFGQDSQTGCLATGKITILDPRFSVYEIALNFATCPGVDSELYNQSMIGLALLDETLMPERLVFSVSGVVNEDLSVFTGGAERL